ncbi:hypothetical protein ACHAXR_002251, partial [Thalassiosira sp. AJA248-18]
MHLSLCKGYAATAYLPLLLLLFYQNQSCCALGTFADRINHNLSSSSRAVGTSLASHDEKTMSPSSFRDEEEEEEEGQFRIGYLSDIEGHWDYFLESVQRSNVLDWEERECPPSVKKKSGNGEIKFQRLVLRPNTHFIYGGDTVDKGPGDIRLVRALVSLKKRYPKRVHLLVGNRDLNKLRFPSELSEKDMKRPLDDIGKPFWDPKAKSLKEYLEDLRETNADNGASLEKLNTRAERLRYMLKHTLGCPDTFEFRREEIQTLRSIYNEYPPHSETHDVTPIHSKPVSLSELMTVEVTDEDVVDSFLYEIGRPEGSLRQYLHLSSIAAIVGNTIFVHGAIDSLTMKFVPALDTKFQVPTSPPPPFEAPYATTPTDGEIIENVHDWFRSLNHYLQHGLEDFVKRQEWNDEHNTRGGEALLAIQNRPSMWGRSVVCNSYADGGVITTEAAVEARKHALHAAQKQLDPLAFEGIASNVMDPVPSKWLLEHGIQRVVVGHKPTGDCPAV